MKRTAVFAVAVSASLLSVRSRAATEYELSGNPRHDGTLVVSVRRHDFTEGMLTLRGADVGTEVKPQIEDLSCDGHTLATGTAPATWLVPTGCRRIEWKIPLDLPEADDASMQRSIRSADGTFCLISEAASIPRFAKASAPELLIVPATARADTLPSPGPDGSVPLPTRFEPPLFILFGSRPVAERSAGRVRVKYYLDDRSQLGNIPPIRAESRGLQWLTSMARVPGMATFTYVWLGVSAKAGSVGGATGKDMLLVNYVRGSRVDPSKTAMLAVTPFIEASHQLSASFGPRPSWVEESLATYLGLEALRYAADAETSARILQKFQNGANRFPFGLIEAQRRVNSADPSAYAAYFTKGVAFWAAVDQAMRAAGQFELASRLPDVWATKFDHEGRPPAEFASVLKLQQKNGMNSQRPFSADSKTDLLR